MALAYEISERGMVWEAQKGWCQRDDDNNGNAPMKKPRRNDECREEKRTFTVYISRDCFLPGVVVASSFKISLSVMSPWDPPAEKAAKYERDTLGLPLFNYKCKHCATNRRSRAWFLTANRRLSDFVNFGFESNRIPCDISWLLQKSD